jgi:hypothetical protein
MGGIEGVGDPRFKVMHKGEEWSLVTRSSDGHGGLAGLAESANQHGSR